MVLKVETLGELVKDLESLREKREEYAQRFKAVEAANQQAMDALVRLLKLLAEARAGITIRL